MAAKKLAFISTFWFWCLLVIFAFGSPGFNLFAGPAEAGDKIFRWRPFLAPFHAVVLHFPIGFLVVAAILEIYHWFRPNEELRRVTTLILALSLASGVAAATFGLMRADTGGYETRALEQHRLFGFLVLTFTSVTLVLQVLSRRRAEAGLHIHLYRGLLTVTLMLLVIAGHLGGNLTHGSNYLVENAPNFIRKMVEAEVPPMADVATQMDAPQRFYIEKVQPIFLEKCSKCHGAEKQKGGFRVDAPEFVTRAGKSEKAPIVPGDPMESHLVKLILLPPDHDDVMPPEGKKSLSSEEIGIILQWVREGAVVPSKSQTLSAHP